jgi:hypothetical protein
MRTLTASGRAPAALLALLLAGGVSAAQAGPYDADRPGWRSLELSAAKFLLRANTRVEARLQSSAQIADSLRDTPVGRPVPPPEVVLELTHSTTGLGRESLTTLWLDPWTGAALQRTQQDSGSDPRLRTYRFTDIGAYHYTRWPATPAEQALPPAQWSRIEEGLRKYDAPGLVGPVTEPNGLLWLAAAAELLKPGDQVQIHAYSRRHLHRVTIEAAAWRSIRVDHEERSPAGSQRRRGTVQALVLRIRGSPLDPAADAEDFELLGLRGDLELLLDPRTRVPLELHGRVRVVGQLTVRLNRVTLR